MSVQSDALLGGLGSAAVAWFATEKLTYNRAYDIIDDMVTAVLGEAMGKVIGAGGILGMTKFAVPAGFGLGNMVADMILPTRSDNNITENERLMVTAACGIVGALGIYLTTGVRR